MRIVPCFVLASAMFGMAHAAVVDVKINGALPTIQQGIDAAGPGDTVRVFSGVYGGSAFIPSGKTGLKLVGVGNVVIDARANGGAPVGRGLVVSADSCLIRKITVRHAATVSQFDAGYGVVASGDGIVLDRVVARRCDTAGFSIVGTGVVAKNCSVFDSELGIRVSGAQATIEKCRVERCVTRGIEVDANGVLLRKNVVRATSTGDGIFVDGDGYVVESNDVRRTGGHAISLRGTDVLARKNRCVGPIAKTGIVWEGDTATIENNVVTDVTGIGIDVLLIGTATVANNKVERVGKWGIRVGEEDIALVDVRSNVVRDAATYGLYLSMDFGAVEGNDIRNCGTASTDAGIRVTLGGTYTDNVVRGGGGDGFVVSADGVVLSNNRAFENAVDGFDIEAAAADVVLDGNVATKNLGEGIEINGTDAIVQNNVSTKNRIDFASSALLQAYSANTIGTGGPLIPPQIE